MCVCNKLVRSPICAKCPLDARRKWLDATFPEPKCIECGDPLEAQKKVPGCQGCVIHPRAFLRERNKRVNENYRFMLCEKSDPFHDVMALKFRMSEDKGAYAMRDMPLWTESLKEFARYWNLCPSCGTTLVSAPAVSTIFCLSCVMRAQIHREEESYNASYTYNEGGEIIGAIPEGGEGARAGNQTIGPFPSLDKGRRQN